MRRQDIQLLASARQGNLAARCDVGRRYLLGADGFPRHVVTGMEYLTHPSVKGSHEVAKIIAESLPLQELLELDQEDALRLAATSGSAVAQFKLGIWQVVRQSNSTEGVRLLKAAATRGHKAAIDALAALERDSTDAGLAQFLRNSASAKELSGAEVSMLAARAALKKKDLGAVARCLRLSLQLEPVPSDGVADLVIETVRLAEDSDEKLSGLPIEGVQASLERRCGHGDYSAAYTLGRALCGIPCGNVKASALVAGTNIRKGAAMLLRAADDGIANAWLHLYGLHADHRSSVANPQMARFFLEKAASAGNTEAQRKLGASILREGNSLKESEQGVYWLTCASRSGDALAKKLLRSMVLPLRGSDEEAKIAIDEVARAVPWLAMRLQLSRDFGLTKLEALTVNPVDGLREWGLVVGRNPFITQSRISAPRAVPAISDDALTRLRVAAEFFAQVRHEGSTIEGDLRHRSGAQRAAFARHRLDEKMFFAEATSATLDALRQGPKWAVRVKSTLAAALA